MIPPCISAFVGAKAAGFLFRFLCDGFPTILAMPGGGGCWLLNRSNFNFVPPAIGFYGALRNANRGGNLRIGSASAAHCNDLILLRLRHIDHHQTGFITVILAPSIDSSHPPEAAPCRYRSNQWVLSGFPLPLCRSC